MAVQINSAKAERNPDGDALSLNKSSEKGLMLNLPVAGKSDSTSTVSIVKDFPHYGR